MQFSSSTTRKNDGHGPSVQFADLSQDNAVGETQTVNGHTNITFDTNALADFGDPGKGEEVAHQGTHGMDDHRRQDPVANSGSFTTTSTVSTKANRMWIKGLGCEPNLTVIALCGFVVCLTVNTCRI